MPSTLEAVQDALRKASDVPTYESAQILSGPDASRVSLLLTSSIRDLERNVKRRVCTFSSFNPTSTGRVEDGSVIEYSFEEKDEVLMSAAHEYVDGERVLFRSCEPRNGGKENRLFVERWTGTSMMQSVEVTGQHGAFNADTAFGRISFHSTIKSRIAYVAEAKKAEKTTYEKYAYEDDWGEKLEGKVQPVILVLDFEGGLSSHQTEEAGSDDKNNLHDQLVVCKPPPGTSCGDMTFAATEGYIVFTGIESSPRRYGLYACTNRRSAIITAKYAGSDSKILSEGYENARSPRYTANGSLFFLTNPASGPHAQCSALVVYSKDDHKTDIAVPVQRDRGQRMGTDEPYKGSAGIYTERTIYSYKNLLYFNTQFQGSSRALAASYSQSNFASILYMADLVPDEGPLHSWSIIGAGKGQLILAKHDVDGTIQLRHLDLRTETTTTFHQRQSPFPGLATYADTFAPEQPATPGGDYRLTLPKDRVLRLLASPSGKAPLVVMPHGGPHASYLSTYSVYDTALAMLGVAVLRVNYTGSTGFGQDSIDALVGSVGERDVADVRRAFENVLSREDIDSKRTCIMGGSHGGFLAAWLLGKPMPVEGKTQFEGTPHFKCGILLNPVMNLATIGAGSDIPDWGTNEADPSGVYAKYVANRDKDPHGPRPYDLQHPPNLSAEDYGVLYKKSPMSVADSVDVPVLMLLGGKDKRVPNYEGKNYVHFLRSRGVKADCYVFPDDGHALDSGDAYRGVFEAIGCFLKEHL